MAGVAGIADHSPHPCGGHADAVFDVKAIYPQSYDEVDINRVPEVFAAFLDGALISIPKESHV